MSNEKDLEQQIEELIKPTIGRVFTDDDFWELSDKDKLTVIKWLELKGLITNGFKTISELIFPTATYVAVEDISQKEYYTIDNDFPLWLKSEDGVKDLTFALDAVCPCGALLAYDETCIEAPFKIPSYWDCSAILLGVADKSVVHTDKLPFNMYKIKER